MNHFLSKKAPKKIGLYFGSFNPIHIGHLTIATHMLKNFSLHQVCFVLSPQNPFKKKEELLPDEHRLKLIQLSIENSGKLAVSDVEFHLPKPSYTAHTLLQLKKKHPQHQFFLIMGSDNFENLEKWKNYEFILKNFELCVYPRSGSNCKKTFHGKGIHFTNAPLMDISSNFIRKALQANENISAYMQPKAHAYLKKMGFYKTCPTS